MKKIYLIQPGQVLSGEVFLPYSIGTLAAYAWQFEDIKKEYDLGDYVFLKEPIDEVIGNMRDPYLVGFSSYMWNINYNLALAGKIKEKWPGAIILFGGPQVPDDTEYLEKYPYIDILMHGEGEITFCTLLRTLSGGGDLAGVNNISFRKNGEIIKTAKLLNRDVSSFNSPYSTGFFDSIVNNPKYSGMRFDAVLETNRGCPYSCIYCYWAGTEKNFRQFGIERVKADIEWMAKNKIVYCICADSNFGILPRDMEITEYIVDMKKKYGYPVKFETTLAKNKDDTTFKIAQMLESVGMNCGISVAVQSMDPQVLENIGRKNISIENFSNLMKMYRSENISTYTDFIIALPGETYDSFCRGVFCAIEAGQHSSINIHPCEVLPNTVLYMKETREKYGIRTRVSTLCQFRTSPSEDKSIGTRSEIIIATDTMSTDDWCKAMRFAAFVQAFHSFGIVKFIAVYLRRNGVSFYDFYTDLFNKIESDDGYLNSVFRHVCRNIDLFARNKSDLYFLDKRFCNVYIHFKDGMFLSCIADKDKLYDDIERFISFRFNSEPVFKSLLQYQKSSIKTPGDEEREEEYDYDWKDYFKDMTETGNIPLIKAKTVLLRDGCVQETWPDYTRDNIWYGKRENKMIHSFSYIR